MPIEALYASTLQRALRTAQIVSQRIGIDIQEREFLMERDVGALSGLTRQDIAREYPEWTKRRFIPNAEATVAGYEKDADFYERVVPNIQALIADHPHQEIAVVTHGGVIGAFCRHVMGITIRGSVELSNAGISTYEVRQGQEHGQMLALNDTCHLNE